MTTIAISIGMLALVVAGTFVAVVRRKNMQLWLPAYVVQMVTRKRMSRRTTKHIVFCFADHFEPKWRDADYETECKRVDRWVEDYPKMASRHTDADGKHPQHTFFFPEEEYREEHLTRLAALCSRGLGEIEVHLHHDDDSADSLRYKLARFIETLHEKHGAFGRSKKTGELAWAFIHGNWALCNSRSDGRYCGVNEELTILRELGCYCDMTLPSAPSDTQTRTVNSIYYATDRPGQPRSHDYGEPVRVGKRSTGDLMIVQGPLALNWKRRKNVFLPSIENGDITDHFRPTKERVDLWVRTGVHVAGRPDWIFIKIHTHGTQEADMDTLLGTPVDRMHQYLGQRYNDGEDYVLHYVTAREMYNVIKAAEAGERGNPNNYRDYVISAPNYK